MSLFKIRDLKNCVITSINKVKFNLAYSSTSLNGRIAGKKSTRVDLEENKTYMWCACGHSAKQPFCDGSHKKHFDGKLQPVKFTVEQSKQYSLCLCKQTKRRPFCDGTHKHKDIQEAVVS